MVVKHIEMALNRSVIVVAKRGTMEDEVRCPSGVSRENLEQRREKIEY